MALAKRADASGWRPRGHTRARRRWAQAGHTAEWCESAHGPSGVAEPAGRCPPGPCPLRTCGGTGGDWRLGFRCAIDDVETASEVRPVSWADHADGLSARRTETGSWSAGVPGEGSFEALPGSRRAAAKCAVSPCPERAVAHRPVSDLRVGA